MMEEGNGTARFELSDILDPHQPGPDNLLLLLLLRWRWTPDRIMPVDLRFDHFEPAGEGGVAFAEVGFPVFFVVGGGGGAVEGSGGHGFAVGVRGSFLGLLLLLLTFWGLGLLLAEWLLLLFWVVGGWLDWLLAGRWGFRI